MKEIALEENWLLPLLELGLPHGSTFSIDVGANAGQWSRAMGQRCAHVVSIEPDYRAHRSLAAALRQSDAMIYAAAGSSQGDATLYLRQHSQQSSILPVHPIGAGSQADAPVVEVKQVSCVTLDEVATKYARLWGCDSVDFVKVDVEGAEGDVLAGATLPLFAKTRWLIESHDRQSQIMTHLARMGFTSVAIVSHPSPNAHPRHLWVYADKEKVS